MVKAAGMSIYSFSRERELFAQWDRKRRAELEARESNTTLADSKSIVCPAPICIIQRFSTASGDESGDHVASSLSAHVWKIKCAVGDVIQSAEHVLVILEAMKTEVNIEAGEEFIGRTVKGFGRGAKEGGSVSAGEPLVYFE